LKSYSEIHGRLEQRIRDLEAKIEHFDALKLSNEAMSLEEVASQNSDGDTKPKLSDKVKRKKKTVTVNDAEWVNSKSDELGPEEVALMLQSKRDSRERKGVKYEPFLLQNDRDKEIFNKLLADMPKGQAFHFDIIIQYEHGGLHCTPLQIHSDGQNVRIFTLDAYYGYDDSHNPNLQAVESIEMALGTRAHVYAPGGLQKDYMSCSIFSIQDLNSMSNIGVDNLPRYLTRADNLEVDDDYIKLHPKFIKNAQSMSLIEDYLNEYQGDTFVDKKKRKMLEEHVENHAINIEVAREVYNSAEGRNETIIQVKAANRSIDYKTLKYLKAAKETLEGLYNEGGEEKVQETLKNRTGRAAFQQHLYEGLTENQVTKVQGLYDKDQIRLALDYDISVEEITNAPCFENPAITKKILKIIQSKFRSQDSKAKELFAQINSFTLAQLAAMECNIDVEIIKSSAGLQDDRWNDVSSDTQSVKDSLFLLSIQNRDLKTAKLLIAQGADIYTKDKATGNTALHLAAANGHVESIVFLLENDFDLEVKNKSGITPLRLAINKWKDKSARVLLVAGANPNIANKDFFPGLFTSEAVTEYFQEAIASNDTKAIQNLLKHHPESVEFVVGEKKETLLSYAIAQKKPEVAAQMIEAGFRVNSFLGGIRKMFGAKQTPENVAKAIGGDILKAYNKLQDAKKTSVDKEVVVKAKDISEAAKLAAKGVIVKFKDSHVEQEGPSRAKKASLQEEMERLKAHDMKQHSGARDAAIPMVADHDDDPMKGH
jgi:hypothetical protein